MLNQALELTITRIALGMISFAHGYFLKVETFTIYGTIGFFATIELPAIAACLLIGGEILGSIALILSAFTRLAAWVSLPNLIGATKMHLGDNWVFSAKEGGWEFSMLIVTLAIAVGLSGAGKYTINNFEWMKHSNLTQSTVE